MRRIAFFVEGQTEQIFLNRLVQEVLGVDNTNVILKQYRGGANVPKREINITRSISLDPRYEVLISDCGSDNRVKSEMMDQTRSLRSRGYEMLVGLRDLYPMSLDELPRLEKGLKFFPKTYEKDSGHLDMIVAIREIETWFIAEYTHFEKMDKRLTNQLIQRRLGFNPSTINPEIIEHPAKTLDDIYRLVGKTYIKRRWQVQRIVRKLDVDFLEREVTRDSKSLNRLISILEDFKNPDKRK
ncbi:DUF4276 family protein [Dysgonomonas massiliensis]|uniref:DUF4276 family protein n=1 Tax=Dysgonomonas massiliensis TaxID=2040292 RepID=UPI000C7840A8|nr:DUF4276 family protein [Dysgonomonas massiliensis]